MRVSCLFAIRRVAVGSMCAAALVASACADAPGAPTGPSASSTGSRIAAQTAAAPRSGEFHVVKNCEDNHGAAGEFCIVTESNVKAIETGTRVIYLQADGPTSTDSDVVLDTPGPGNNRAFGHCLLDFTTATGLCTFDGGTGKFTGFHASATGRGTGRSASTRASAASPSPHAGRDRDPSRRGSCC